MFGKQVCLTGISIQWLGHQSHASATTGAGACASIRQYGNCYFLFLNCFQHLLILGKLDNSNCTGSYYGSFSHLIVFLGEFPGSLLLSEIQQQKSQYLNHSLANDLSWREPVLWLSLLLLHKHCQTPCSQATLSSVRYLHCLTIHIVPRSSFNYDTYIPLQTS